MFNNLLKKIIVCPACGQRSRVPIKPGKVLRVTCPSCNNIFEIKFESSKPNLNSFNFESMINNLKNFPNLPIQQKISYILMGITLIVMLRSCSQNSVDSPRYGPQQNSSPSYEESNIINL